MRTLSFPTTFTDGGFTDVQDDTEYSIAQSLLTHCYIPRGSFPMNRGYGVYNYLEQLRDHVNTNLSPSDLIAVFEAEGVLNKVEVRPSSIYVDMYPDEANNTTNVIIEYNYNNQKNTVTF